MYLPKELVEVILKNININIVDVVNFSLTAMFYHNMIYDNHILWTYKFYQSWPSLINVCEIEWSYRKINIRQESIERMKCRKELLNYFSVLNKKYWNTKELSSSDFQDFSSMFCDGTRVYSMKFYYLLDELTNFLIEFFQQSKTKINLAHLHYAKQVFIYMKQCCFKNEWQKFKDLLPNQQVLEKALFITFQWCLNDIVSVSSLSVKLNEVIDKTLKLLEEKSLFSNSDLRRHYCRNNNILVNLWDSEKTKQMLHVIHHILYDKFIQCVQIYYPLSEVQFMIIFHAIARTFGIRCNVSTAQNKIFLTWRESYNRSNPDYKNIYVVNIFSEKLTFEMDLIVNEEPYPIASLLLDQLTPTQLMKLCGDDMWYSLHNTQNDYTILNFHHMVDSENIDTIFHLNDSFILCEMNLKREDILNTALADVSSSIINTRVAAILNTIKAKFSLELSGVHRRKPFIKYAIGMIVYVKRTMSLGVICGWKIYVPKWFHNMMDYISIDRFDKYFPSFVYYIIFTYIGKLQKVNEDKLTPLMTDVREADITQIIQVLNNRIGQYFSYFKGTHFIPNPVLEEIFPDDANFREQWLADNPRNQ